MRLHNASVNIGALGTHPRITETGMSSTDDRGVDEFAKSFGWNSLRSF